MTLQLMARHVHKRSLEGCFGKCHVMHRDSLIFDFIFSTHRSGEWQPMAIHFVTFAVFDGRFTTHHDALRELILKIRTKLGLNDMSTCAASCSSDDMKNLLKDESQTVKTVKHIKFVKFVLGPGFAPNRWPSSRMELLHLLGAPKWRWRQARRLAKDGHGHGHQEG